MSDDQPAASAEGDESSWEVVAVEEEEARERLRPWLQQAFLGKPQPELYQVCAGDDGAPVGAASLRIYPPNDEGRTSRFLIWVEPDWRRKRIGTAIMKRLIERCREVNTTEFVGGRGFAPDDGVAKFFEHLGCYPLRELDRFQVPVDHSLAYLTRIYNRLERHGKIPEGFETVTLDKANPERINLFVRRHLGGFPETLQARLKAMPPEGFIRRLSYVVRSREGIAAVLLVRRTREGLLVDTRIVSPGHRGTWANVHMLKHFLEQVQKLPQKVERVYFEADIDQHQDTVVLARHGNGSVISRSVIPGLRLDKEGNILPSERRPGENAAVGPGEA